jgi:hypothetical protein
MRKRINQISDDRFKNGANFIEDLLHEKALDLLRFGSKKKQSVKDELMGENRTTPKV